MGNVEEQIYLARIQKLFLGNSGIHGALGREVDVNRIVELMPRQTRELFESCPICVAKNGAGAATGTTGDENLMKFEDNIFEYHILGAGQTIVAPVFGANGLDIALDQGADEGVEISQGITARSRGAFVIGTDAFYGKCTIKIADVSGSDDCAFGFRKAEAYQANIDDYNDMAVLNIISGAINIETILNNAATSTTDTTDTVDDATEITLEVYVSKGGVVTFKVDGSEPTVVASFTFDDGDTVIPFLYFLHDTDLAGAVYLTDWEVGLQL